MTILPQLPLYAIAIICGLLSFLVTRLTMPRIIRKLEAADIVGKDIHKSWKPVVAEMGGFGILFGFIIGMLSGIYKKQNRLIGRLLSDHEEDRYQREKHSQKSL